jgi:hypothetical protein
LIMLCVSLCTKLLNCVDICATAASVVTGCVRVLVRLGVLQVL